MKCLRRGSLLISGTAFAHAVETTARGRIVFSQLFSMVMFPDVVDRLNEAYREMLADPEKHSALSEVFCTLADSKDAALHFAQSCVLLARTDEGRKVTQLQENLTPTLRVRCRLPAVVMPQNSHIFV